MIKKRGTAKRKASRTEPQPQSFRMPPRRTPKPPSLTDPEACVKCRQPGSTCGDCGVVLCYTCNVNPHVEQGHQPKAHLEAMDPKELEPKGRLKPQTEQRQQASPPGPTLEQAITQLVSKLERYMANNPIPNAMANNPNPNPPQQPTPQPGTAPAPNPNPAPTPQPKV
jgi:hypothetical protein